MKNTCRTGLELDYEMDNEYRKRRFLSVVFKVVKYHKWQLISRGRSRYLSYNIAVAKEVVANIIFPTLMT